MPSPLVRDIVSVEREDAFDQVPIRYVALFREDRSVLDLLGASRV